MTEINQKKKDYKKYKLYERKHEKVLIIAKEQAFSNLTIEQLLHNYAIVERMYEKRTRYRDKYFNFGKSDTGHQQYIDYLVNILDTYRLALHDRFTKPSQRLPTELKEIKEIEQYEETEETEEHKEICQQKEQVSKISKRVDEIFKQEKELWDSQIPKLMGVRQYATDRFTRKILKSKSLIQKYIPTITDIQITDIIHYFTSCHIFVSGEIKITDGHIFCVYSIPPIASSLAEYVSKNLDNANFIISNIIKNLPELEKQYPNIFFDLITSILNASAGHRKYQIISICVFKKLNLFIPTANIRTVATKNKALFAYEPKIKEFSIVVYKKNLFSTSNFSRLDIKNYV